MSVFEVSAEQILDGGYSRFQKNWQDILRFVGHYFLYSALSILCKSLRIEKINFQSLNKLKLEGSRYVLAFWHGTMLLPWHLHGNPNVVALISKSKDGDLLAKLLKKWDYKVVRGSSSAGGEIAFKAGAAVTARKSGLPIILVGIGYHRKKILKNWDKFEVPFFFSKAKVVYSDPIYLNVNLKYNETSEKISFCENELNRLQNEAQNFNP